MSRRYHTIVSAIISLFFLIDPCYSVNKISLFGIVKNVEGAPLADTQLTLKQQKKSVTTNRFGEFDFGKVFPGDTLLVVIDGFQQQSLLPETDMEIKLYPKSEIQDLINNARSGATIIIPSGVHYIYPDFNKDSTVGMSINYKSDITIIGELNSEIRLKWYNADIFYIHESNNISLKNLSIGYYDSNQENNQNFKSYDDVENFGNAFRLARSELGKNSIFRYRGKLYHTNNSNESFEKIIPGRGINIYKSSDIYIDSLKIFGENNICLNARNSKNISIKRSETNQGLYGFVFNNCTNVSIANSLISDNREIIFNKNAQIELNENTIKVEGSYVPEFVDIMGGSIEMLDETIIPPPEPTYLTANSFSISRTEVTFKQFDAFCVATNREKPDDSEWGRGDRPVINITYADAIAYCDWLGSLLSKAMRLPTVAEWEYAARGGVNGGDDNLYSGSNILEDVSWCKFNSNERTQPVGLKKSNELGIYDMSGNVYEFCGGVEDSMIVLKGGSWVNSGVGCRLSDHVVSKVDFWDDNIGFRCVVSEL
tara:strand:+ start:688 stop:2307 length:1620 start_codon:yes stop_codon:yes gene_type:complete